jgi:hypothetical protein
VANTGRVSNDIKAIGNNFEVSNHTFLGQISSGIQGRVGETVSGLKVVPTGKKAARGDISVTLVGQVTLEKSDDVETANEKVRQLMDSLKNPSNLISLLGG